MSTWICANCAEKYESLADAKGTSCDTTDSLVEVVDTQKRRRAVTLKAGKRPSKVSKRGRK